MFSIQWSYVCVLIMQVYVMIFTALQLHARARVYKNLLYVYCISTLDLCRYTSPGRTLIGINGLLMTYTRRCAVTWAFYTYKLLRSMWCDALVKAIVMTKLYRQRVGCGVPGQVLPTTSHKPMYVHTTHANGSLTYWLLWQGLFSLRNSFQILQ